MASRLAAAGRQLAFDDLLADPPARAPSADAMTAERYVDASELAQLMGVSVRTIRRWTAAGMPSEDWGLGHTRRYLPSRAIGWARARATMTGVTPGARANAAGTNQRRR